MDLTSHRGYPAQMCLTAYFDGKFPSLTGSAKHARHCFTHILLFFSTFAATRLFSRRGFLHISRGPTCQISSEHMVSMVAQRTWPYRSFCIKSLSFVSLHALFQAHVPCQSSRAWFTAIWHASNTSVLVYRLRDADMTGRGKWIGPSSASEAGQVT
jgi:hypothetical protein